MVAASATTREVAPARGDHCAAYGRVGATCAHFLLLIIGRFTSFVVNPPVAFRTRSIMGSVLPFMMLPGTSRSRTHATHS